MFIACLWLSFNALVVFLLGRTFEVKIYQTKHLGSSLLIFMDIINIIYGYVWIIYGYKLTYTNSHSYTRTIKTKHKNAYIIFCNSI